MMPHDVERYVLLASDASNMELQQQANNFLNQWVTSNNDNVLADTIIEVVRLTQREVVLFYALTVFSRLDNAGPQQRSVFRQEIFTQLFRSSSSPLIAAGANNPSPAASVSNNYHNRSSWSPTYLRTKIGVLLARFIQLDFPHAWPSAFDDLQSPLMLQHSPDILLRTLVALTDEFGRDETEVNTKIKDLIRGYNNDSSNLVTTPQQSISGRLINTILSILERALTETNGRAKEQIQIYGVLSLTALKGFLSWVDISLAMGNEKVLRLIYAALARGSTVDAESAADAGVVAVECMEELIARGMNDEKKLSMLVHTKVLETIHSSVDLVTVDASPIDVVLEVAKFINRTGLEVFPIILEQQAKQQVGSGGGNDILTLSNQLLELFFRCFAFDDIDVSGAVIPLAASLISLSDPQKHLQQQESLLPKLLTITYNQMRYPSDFQYDFEDDDEAEEEMYRTELRKLNQKFIRSNPELCLQFTCQVLSVLPLPLSAAPTPHVEVAISLVYQYCEGIRPPPGMKVVMQNETFCNLLVGLHTSDIIEHPHREILTLYYETSVRYYPLLRERPDLLQKVLGAMTGTRGLQHENAKVRSRCCYLLLRLIKSVGSSGSKKTNEQSFLRPYVEGAVSGIQGLLENKSIELRVEDTLNLFETIGLLLGKNGLSPSEQGQYLTQVMTPHVRSIEMILNDKKQEVLQDPDTYGETLSNSIAAIAYLSKGFRKPPSEVQNVLLETLQIALSVLEALPNNDEVRNKTYVFVQRLIQLLEDSVLKVTPRLLFLLIQHCNTEDILDVSQLMNQLCIKFKSKATCALDSNLLPFLQKCHHLSNTIATENVATQEHQQGPVAPHLRTEQLSIQKLSYAVLNHVVSNDVTSVLLSPTNVSSLEAILQSMSEGAINVEDSLMKKTCLIFFRMLFDQWVPNPNAASNGSSGVCAPDFIIQGYVTIICDVLTPGMFQLFCRTDGVFNVNDANDFRLVVEFARILEIFKTRLPEVLGNLMNRISMQIQMPAPVLDGLRTANSRKQFEECFRALIQNNLELQKNAKN
eukprot:jgi/Psemu1/185823/e_gw1.52.10.1